MTKICGVENYFDQSNSCVVELFDISYWGVRNILWDILVRM